jgi:DNA-binding MarR family transcriptional regulator
VDLEIRLALAVRDLVLAVERYRSDTAQHDFGVGITETVALGHLHVDGPLTASQLATKLRITSASATELVDRMERSGYAHRLAHPTDRRKRLVTLTERGHLAVNRYHRDLGSQLAATYESMDNDQQKGIDLFLSAASGNLTRQSSRSPRTSESPRRADPS